MPTAAFAQSTGSVDFEKETIVVTGTRTQDVGGVQAPDAPKAKAVLTQEMISRSGPGQTVLDTINVVPGVSFQNNDAYGNAGGTLSVRGFDSTRVSYTLDGIQLNDSGNYNIYSNFSIDPELIEQVNVSLGSTDVDSPTASAVGGTINQRTRTPGKEFGGRVQRLARRVRLSPLLRHARHRRVHLVGHARVRRRQHVEVRQSVQQLRQARPPAV